MNCTFILVFILAVGPAQITERQPGVGVTHSSIAEQLAEAERLMENFRSRWAVPLGSDGKPLGMDSPNEKLMTLESVVTELELDALGKEALWNSTRLLQPEQMPMTPEVQALLVNDPKLTAYERDLRDIEEALRRSKQKYGAAHQVVKQLQEQYDVANRRFTEETAVKTLTFKEQTIAKAQQSYLQSQDMLLKANDLLAREKSEQRGRDQKMAEYLRLLEDRDSLRAKLFEQEEAATLARLRAMTLGELRAAVNRTHVALDKAQRAHLQAVDALLEAINKLNQTGKSDSASQPDSRPAGESGN